MPVSLIDRVLRGISLRLAQAACGLLLAIMILTVLDTGLRYLAGRPIGGSNEMIEIMLSFLIMLSIPYCTVERAAYPCRSTERCAGCRRPPSG